MFIRYRKETIISIIAVVLIAVILLVGRSVQSPSDESQNAEMEEVSEAMASSTATSTATSTTTKPKTTSGLTYTQAVNQYKDRRIQFDSNCIMSPNPISLRNNTVVMLDNRSPSPRSVYIDRTKYNLGGYGFKLVTLRFSNLPHTAIVDCGSGRNTGTITIQ